MGSVQLIASTERATASLTTDGTWKDEDGEISDGDFQVFVEVFDLEDPIHLKMFFLGGQRFKRVRSVLSR